MKHTKDVLADEKIIMEEEATMDQQTDASVSQDIEEVITEEPIVVESELEVAQKLADDNYQKYLRAQADFDNFRRRSRQEKEEFAKYASSKLIEQLLPVVDSFERALATGKETTDTEALLKGVDMIFRMLSQVLEQEGLKSIEAVGQPFNPDFHQAIMTVENAEHDEGIVIEEIQKGYNLKDKILRPSMVKVSS
ncbi:MAG: nucleotide exchange factor GrpE [Paenibacillaceae bacterium]